MTRPFYETEAHRVIQHKAKLIVEERRNCQIKDTKKGSVFDWGVFRGNRVTEFAEFKARYIDMSKGKIKKEGVMLSAKKIETIHAMCRRKTMQIGTQVNFVFYVWCTSGLYMIALPCEGASLVRNGGRTASTRDAGDIEDVMMLPVRFFVRLDAKGVPDAQS